MAAGRRALRFAVGDAVEAARRFGDPEVRAFAALSGDHNPIHLDEKAASASRFGRRVVHGILVSSMFSGLVGSRLPGPGSVYLSQTLQFHAPVFLDELVTARVQVTSINAARRTVELSTECRKEDGSLAISGAATALFSRSPPEPSQAWIVPS